MAELKDIFGEAIDASKTGDTSTVTLASASVSEERSKETPTTEPMCRLAAYVMNEFTVNVDHRRNSGVDEKLTKCLLAHTCNYTEDQKSKLRRAGIATDLYTPITHTKVRAAKALLGDIFQNSNDIPFMLKPTPDPSMAAEIEQQVAEHVQNDIKKVFEKLSMLGIEEIPGPAYAEFNRIIQRAVSSRYDEIKRKRDDIARKRAKRMECKVHDILVEGGWTDAFQEYVNYICVYGTGIILGPIPRVMAVNASEFDEEAGVSKYVRVYREIPTYEAVNPCDVYPAPSAKTVNDGPLCIRVRYTASDLWRYVQKVNDEGKTDNLGHGWMIPTINSLLAKFPNGGVHLDMDRYDPTRKYAEKSGVEDVKDCVFEGVRCFATVRGSELLDIGILKTREGKNVKQKDYYQIETIVIGGYVVYVRILDERIGRPVSKGVFYELPNSWWGEAIAEKLALVQNVMNNCVKSLLTNMSAASGPMYWINDVSRLTDRGIDGLTMRPHKVWPFQSGVLGSTGAPMGVIQIPSNASELLGVFEKFKMQADDDSGIPAYTYGQASGAGAAMRTAQGLSIFTEAASRGMRMVIMTTDRLVIRDVVKKTANYVLLYDDDMDIKGDCEVVPTGIMGKILKAQQDQERIQLLGLVINNQTLTSICGIKGIMALLRPSIVDLNINADDVLPSAERVEELEVLQRIMQIAQAQTQSAQANQAQIANVQQANAPQGDVPQTGGQVVQPGDQPPSVPAAGSVAERRSVA